MMATLHSMADHSAAPTLSSGSYEVRVIFLKGGDQWGEGLTGWISRVGNHEKTAETEDTGDQDAGSLC